MTRLTWLFAGCLAVTSCNGTSPTAPTGPSGGDHQTAGTYTLSGVIVTSAGGPPGSTLVVGIAGGPSASTDAMGRFVLVGAPVHLDGVSLRIGGRDVLMGFSVSSGQSVHVDIRLDVETGTATVSRLCSDTPAPPQSPGAGSVSLSMCIGRAP